MEQVCDPPHTPAEFREENMLEFPVIVLLIRLSAKAIGLAFGLAWGMAGTTLACSPGGVGSRSLPGVLYSD